MNFNNIQNTAPSISALRNEYINVPRSAVDRSFSKSFTGLIGAIMPINVQRTLPNSDSSYSVDVVALTHNPLIKQLFTGMRLYVHTYLAYDWQLWEGAPNQKTQGRSGTIHKQVPKILLRDYKRADGTSRFTSSVPSCDYATVHSLADFLSLGISSFNPGDSANPVNLNESYVRLVTNNGSDKSYKSNVKKLSHTADWEANALPFVMYQKICRDYFFNANLIQENKRWYPDNENDFILPYNIPQFYDGGDTVPSENYVNCLDYNNPILSADEMAKLDWSPNGNVYVPNSYKYSSDTPEVDDTPVILTALHFRQFKGDIYNTALPFKDLVRGKIPTLEDFGSIDFSALANSILGTVVNTSAIRGSGSSGQPNYSVPAGTPLYANTVSGSGNSAPINITANGSVITGGTPLSSKMSLLADTDFIRLLNENVKIKTSIDLNLLRELETLTIFKERMALADGSYNSLIQAQFGVNPGVNENTPMYCGGDYQDIYFNDVTQMSETDKSPLGSTASKGVSGSQGKTIHIHSKDFGYIMTVLEIVPDVFYSNQGISKMWNELDFEDVYYPILNNLSPQEIKNKELFVSGNKDIDQATYGHTERFIQLKHEENKIGGMMSLPVSFGDGNDNSSYTGFNMRRRFEDTPKLNNQFVTMCPKNIDMSVFQNKLEHPFDIMVTVHHDFVGPLPYETRPSNMGIKY